MIDDGKVNKVPNPSYLAPEAEQRKSRWYHHEEEHDVKVLERGHRRFDSTLRMMKVNLESERRFMQGMVDHFVSVVASWSKAQIIGIDVPTTGRLRDMRDAFNPDEQARRDEHLAAKAARDAKPGKITLNVYAGVKFPARDAGLSDEEWRAGIEAHYAAEKAFKDRVKAWAKAKFPGKIWVGDGDTFEAERASGIKRFGASEESLCCIAIKPEWQYLDQVMAMFPNAHRYDKDTNRRDPVTKHGLGKGKDIRLWVSVDSLPA